MTMMLAWLWQGLTIALATAALLRLAPRLNAATRYVIWWMALLSVLAVPIAHWVVPTGQAVASSGVLGASSTLGHGHPLLPALVLPAPPDWVIECVAGAWLGSVLLGLGRIARGLHLLVGLKRHARPIDTRLERTLPIWNRPRHAGRRAELRVSSDVTSACALGLFGEPVIVLSDRLVSTLDADSLDQIVMHEQAHLSRYDDWTRLLQACATTVLGLHPAVRFIDAQIDLEREAACDDAVVERTGGAARYAACLAEAADAAARGRHPAPSVVPNAEGTGALLVRVRRLLDPRVNRRGRLHVAATAAGLVAFTAAAAAGPSAATMIVVLEAIAGPPPIQGRWDHRTVDWTSRGLAARPAPLEASPSSSVRQRTRIRRTERKEAPVRAAVSSVPSAAPDQIAAAPIVAVQTEPVPLTSTAVISPVAATTVAAPPDRAPGWRAAGEAGVAVGRGFTRMGVATGSDARRAGAAVGGFFSRAGKAVADRF